MKKLILVFILMLFYGCNPYRIIKETDKFYPNRIMYYSTPVNIKSSNPFDMAELTVQFINVVSPDTLIYGMAFNYIGQKWAFMESTKFLVDGKIFDILPATQPVRKVTFGNFVNESLGIRFSSDQVEILKNAKSIDIRIKGNNRIFDISFDENIKIKLNNFLLRKDI